MKTISDLIVRRFTRTEDAARQSTIFRVEDRRRAYQDLQEIKWSVI